jgi:ATP-binding cassette subfamily F protein 3
LEKSKASNERAALTAGFTDARPTGKGSGEKTASVNAGGPAAPTSTSVSASSAAKTAPSGNGSASAPKLTPNQLKKLRIEVGKLEQRVSELEAKQSEITAALESPETYSEPGKAQHLNRELSVVVDQLQAATAEWEKAATDLANAGG